MWCVGVTVYISSMCMSEFVSVCNLIYWRVTEECALAAAAISSMVLSLCPHILSD